MFKRLLLVMVVGVVFLTGCAKPPVAELEETRRIVAYAYAAGASQLAADLYQAASNALQTAEDQVHQRKYKAAQASLELARNYSNLALTLTVQRKKQLELDQQKREEEKRHEEEKRRAELLRKQQEEKARRAAVKRQVEKPPVVVEIEEPKLLDKVEVAAAENLQMIASRPDVYNDGMLWPLLYKANRDQIKDPKEIFPGQILQIPRDKNKEEIEAARAEALELNLF
ncbi:LysM peptidoglycan-binding domain-containing protein [Malonomonas rubra]|uniref:LysM peptidoglycan-binding domain-containing protein n=1 Tax=Malonomonas rubra TaxID=57040 RepID=UPI0026EF6153|nr:LysM peptidoglycan-binding domain-containing protein [Malonomonas rubra]